jgi:hypothetical protein
MLLKFADSYQLEKPVDKEYLHLLRKEGAVGVAVRGIFISTGGPFGPEGKSYELLIESVLQVRKLSKEYRQRFDIGSGKTNVKNSKPEGSHSGPPETNLTRLSLNTSCRCQTFARREESVKTSDKRR